jgi:hypothetical protein
MLTLLPSQFTTKLNNCLQALISARLSHTQIGLLNRLFLLNTVRVAREGHSNNFCGHFGLLTTSMEVRHL